MGVSSRLVSSINAVTVLFAIAGGVFFGLFSCGGYAWHRQLFCAVFLILLFIVVALPPRNCKASFLKFTSALAIFLCFVVTEAVASTFYPAGPASFGEFFSDFVVGIKHGSC